MVLFHIASYRLLSAALLALIPGSAALAELPEAARKLISNAARDGDTAELAAVVKFARQTYPDDGIEIDSLVLALQNLRADRENVAAPTVPPVPPATHAPLPALPAIKWSGRGDLGGFQTSGNTNSFGITVGGTLSRKGPNVAHQLRIRGDYHENEGKKSREYLNAAYQGDWSINDRQYALAIAEYERDVLAGIAHRATASLGLGWRAVKSDTVLLSLEAGPAYRHEWYLNGNEKSTLAGRGALTSSWQMNEKVRLSHNMELVTEDQNNTVRTITGLQAKLTGRISSQISYDLRYQDRPLFGKEQADTVTRIGLTYDF
ncbi:MAG: DUF481 domain-containing protein [Sphingorhabdus sp.]